MCFEHLPCIPITIALSIIAHIWHWYSDSAKIESELRWRYAAYEIWTFSIEEHEIVGWAPFVLKSKQKSKSHADDSTTIANHTELLWLTFFGTQKISFCRQIDFFGTKNDFFCTKNDFFGTKYTYHVLVSKNIFLPANIYLLSAKNLFHQIIFFKQQLSPWSIT